MPVVRRQYTWVKYDAQSSQYLWLLANHIRHTMTALDILKLPRGSVGLSNTISLHVPMGEVLNNIKTCNYIVKNMY